MKCQDLFSRENKKSISECCLLEFLLSPMLSINSNNGITALCLLHYCLLSS